MQMTRPRRLFSRFLRCERGVVLTEFAISLPLILVVFAVIVESGRTFWSYQAAISGVRDATRYLARLAPLNSCPAGDLSGYDAQLTTIVTRSVTGTTIFPPRVTVTQVSSELTCVSGTLRQDPAPVASVTAEVTIELPFAGVFRLVGGDLSRIDTEITDSARIYGI